MVRTPPRELPTNIAGPTPSAIRTLDDVGEFDHAIVVGMVGVMIGMAAAAQVDRDDVPLRRTGRQRRREFVEIGGGAGETRQADHRQSRCGTRAIFAHMDTQPVLRRDEQAFALIDARRDSGSGTR